MTPAQQIFQEGLDILTELLNLRADLFTAGEIVWMSGNFEAAQYGVERAQKFLDRVREIKAATERRQAEK